MSELMQKLYLFSKLHQCRVTQADLNYEGSFSIDEEAMEQAKIKEFEQIHVYNIENGARFITYAIKAPRHSRVYGANGACARLVSVGDRVIICSYALFNVEDFSHQPTVLLFNDVNEFSMLKQ